MPPRALTPSGLVLFDKPAGPSSFAIVRDLRDRTGARAGHAGTLDPFATGLLLVLLGASRRRRSASSGSPSATRRRSTSRPARRPAIPRARSSTSTSRRPAGARARIDDLRGEVDLRIPTASAVKIGGERAYKLHRRGVVVEMPMRRTTVHTLELLDYDGRSPASACTSAPAATCVRSPRRSGTLREPSPHTRRSVRPGGCRPGAHRPARRLSRAASSTGMKVARSPQRARGRPARGRPRHVRRRAHGPPARDRAGARGRPEPTVVTFDPHPRTALGNRVELLTTLERRLELLEELGVQAALVVEFTLELARLEPEQFVEQVLRPIEAEVVVAGADFRFGHGRKGDLELLRSLGFDVRPVPLVEGVSSSRDPRPRSCGRRRGRGEAPRPARRGRGNGRRGGGARRDARVSDRKPRRAARAARTGQRDLRRRRSAGTARQSRSARTPTTAARAPRRGAPARLLRRPLRTAARRRALAAPAGRAGLRDGERANPADRARRRVDAQGALVQLNAA